jgi:nickel-dependent lactate racemase
VDRIFGVEIDDQYDLVIASAGGFPLDIDLRQAHKGLENACRALRPGGTILFYAECPNGPGIKSFEEYVHRYQDDLEMQKALQKEFVVGGHKAYWVARLGRCYQVHLVSGCDEDFVRRCHLLPVLLQEHEKVLEALVQNVGHRSRIAVIPHAGFTLPSEHNRVKVS